MKVVVRLGWLALCTIVLTNEVIGRVTTLSTFTSLGGDGQLIKGSNGMEFPHFKFDSPTSANGVAYTRDECIAKALSISKPGSPIGIFLENSIMCWVAVQDFTDVINTTGVFGIRGTPSATLPATLFGTDAGRSPKFVFDIMPTPSPTLSPTTLSPTLGPTSSPTLRPSTAPTARPTPRPTLLPTLFPTLQITTPPSTTVEREEDPVSSSSMYEIIAIGGGVSFLVCAAAFCLVVRLKRQSAAISVMSPVSKPHAFAYDGGASSYSSASSPASFAYDGGVSPNASFTYDGGVSPSASFAYSGGASHYSAFSERDNSPPLQLYVPFKGQ